MIQRFSEQQAARLWDDRFTFFWYNAPEIFHWRQEDYDRRARLLHDSGITIVMTFSSTHFRATFIPWRERILEAIRRICRACHRYGIRVLEHHSCCLTYNPVTPEDRLNFRTCLEVHHSGLENFPGLEDFMSSGMPFRDVRLQDLVQIDGRTGKPADTGYAGNAFCFNNPVYRRIYLSYVDDLKEAGVDCILADDVQFFGGGNACVCPHCRRLFREETGLELPPPEQWEDFRDHFERPEYIAWLRFRQRSTADWQKTLTEHYRSIGLDPYRANYRSDLIGRDFTANAFTVSRNDWAQVCQENCFSEVIRYCWPRFQTESLLQYAVARGKNSASMSLFYPDRRDQYYFAWALAESWGQLPFLCPEAGNMPEEDAFFNDYERRHADLFRQPEKDADLAFLMSRETFDYAPSNDTVPSSYTLLRGTMNGAYFDSLVCDAVLEDEPPEAFLAQPCIVAAGVVRVSGELAGKLLSYVEQGGRLLVLGGFALYDPPEERSMILVSPNTRILPADPSPDFHQAAVWQKRMYAREKNAPAPVNRFSALKNEYGGLFRANLPRVPMIASVPDGYLAQAYRLKRNPGAMALHLIHIDGLLDAPGDLVSHDDPILHFEPDSEKNPAPLEVTLNRTGFHAALLHTPEQDRPLQVGLAAKDGRTVLRIPAGAFAGYAVVELKADPGRRHPAEPAIDTVQP